MGYSTDFDGSFKVEPPLKPRHLDYLKKFNETRRMSRDAKLAEKLPDEIRIAAGLPIGEEGEFFVGGTGLMGQDDDVAVKAVSGGNSPPGSQPGLWCKWVPNEDGSIIGWDGGEKFYFYAEWLQYLVDKFLQPWGYKISGEVTWYGEDHEDTGKIIAKDNVITTKIGTIVYS